MKRLLIALGAAIVLLILLSAWTRVDEDELAVLDPRFSAPRVLERGFHFKVPLFSRVSHYPLSPQQTEGEVQVQTRDNFTFPIHYTMETVFDPESLLAFHARRAGRDLGVVLTQLANESVEKATSYLRADEILGSIGQERWRAVLFPPTQERGIKVTSITVASPEPSVVVNAALLYQRRKLPNAAVQLIRQALEQQPGSAHLLYGLGRLHEMQGDEKKAEEEYVQALFLNPTATEPMGRLVGLLLKHREFDRAHRMLEAALSEDRSSAAHFNWLAITLQLQAKYEESRQAFEEALRLEPDSAEYHANYGALLMAAGDVQAAQAALKDAIRISPDNSLALYNLGIALAQDGKPSEAIPFFERAEQSGPPSVGLLNALAQAYQEAGQSAKAAAVLQRSLSLRPNQPEQRKQLSDLRNQKQ